jgi:hypothetical protein
MPLGNIRGVLNTQQRSGLNPADSLRLQGVRDTDYSSSESSSFASYIYQQQAEAVEGDVGKANTSLPFSLVNAYALYQYRGMYGSAGGNTPSDYRDVDRFNRLARPEVADNPTAAQIIDYFNNRYKGLNYSYGDFLYCKYYKQIPNNYMVTLRRFATPVEDNIYDLQYSQAGKNGGADLIANANGLDIARAVTWMSEATGNKLDDLLKFSYGFNWEELSSEIESNESSQGLGVAGTSWYQSLGGGLGGSLKQGAVNALLGKSYADILRAESFNGRDPLLTTYPNYVLGPVNVINKMTVRKPGLNFDFDMELKFQYELKSFNHVNPRIAMLDVFSNFMTLTYNNAPFFGGANRFYGSAGYIKFPFGDIGKLRSGDPVGYMASVVGDAQGSLKNVITTGDGGIGLNFNNLKDFVVKGATNALGSLLNGIASKFFGSHAKGIAVPAFLSGQPTGSWHVTVGNPMNPIMMMGNMICESVDVNFKGGLGYDDFPTEVEFTVKLKPARPRDKSDIENMLNGGHGRLYARAESVQDLVGDVLNISGKDEKLQPYAQLNRGTNGGGSVNFRNGTRLSAGEQRVGRVIDNTVANPRGVLKQASESEIAKTALYALQ